MIALHIILLASAIVLTVLLLVFFPKGRRSSTSELAWGLLPFVLLAAASFLLLSAGGYPITEWMLPFVCSTLLWGVGGSNWRYRAARTTLVFMSAYLCYSSVYLAQGDYAAATGLTISKGPAIQKTAFRAAAVRALRKKFTPESTLPPGRIDELTDRPSLAYCEIDEFEREWHSWFTLLYRRKPVRTELWSAGGPLEDAIASLEFRTASPEKH